MKKSLFVLSLVLAVVAILGLAVAGCGSSTTTAAPSGSTTTAAPAGSTTAVDTDRPVS